MNIIASPSSWVSGRRWCKTFFRSSWEEKREGIRLSWIPLFSTFICNVYIEWSLQSSKTRECCSGDFRCRHTGLQEQQREREKRERILVRIHIQVLDSLGDSCCWLSDWNEWFNITPAEWERQKERPSFGVWYHDLPWIVIAELKPVRSTRLGADPPFGHLIRFLLRKFPP